MHPLSWRTPQSKHTEQNNSLKDLEKFHQQYYVGSNTTIHISGPVNPGATSLNLYKEFKGLPKGEKNEHKNPFVPYRPVDIRYPNDQGLSNTHYAVGFAYDEVDDDINVEDVFNSYIHLKLDNKTRGLEKRIGYTQWSSKDWSTDNSKIFVFNGDTRPEESHEILPTIANILNEISNGHINDITLEAAINSCILINDDKHFLNKKYSRPSQANKNYYEKIGCIENVTAPDLQEFAIHLMTYRKPSIVTMGDASNVQSIEEFEGMLENSFLKALESGNTVPKI